jgi:hypothetical protein
VIAACRARSSPEAPPRRNRDLRCVDAVHVLAQGPQLLDAEAHGLKDTTGALDQGCSRDSCLNLLKPDVPAPKRCSGFDPKRNSPTQLHLRIRIEITPPVVVSFPAINQFIT